MKPTYLFLLITVPLLAIIVWLRSTRSTLDIQLYDTYFIIEYWLLLILVVLLLTCCISLGIAIYLRFSNPVYNRTALISGFLLVAYFAYVFFVTE